MQKGIRLSKLTSLPRLTSEVVNRIEEKNPKFTKKKIRKTMAAMRSVIYDSAFEGEVSRVIMIENERHPDMPARSKAARYLSFYIDVIPYKKALDSRYFEGSFKDTSFPNLFFKLRLVSILFDQIGYIIIPIQSEIEKRVPDAIMNNKTKLYIKNGKEGIFETGFPGLSGRGRRLTIEAAKNIDAPLNARYTPSRYS